MIWWRSRHIYECSATPEHFVHLGTRTREGWCCECCDCCPFVFFSSDAILIMIIVNVNVGMAALDPAVVSSGCTCPWVQSASSLCARSFCLSQRQAESTSQCFTWIFCYEKTRSRVCELAFSCRDRTYLWCVECGCTAGIGSCTAVVCPWKLDRNRVGLAFVTICMELVRTNKRGLTQVWSDYETHHVGIGYAKPWNMNESAWNTSWSRLVSWNVCFDIPKCNDAVSNLLWTIEPWHSIDLECQLCLDTVSGIAEAAPKLYVLSTDTWCCSSFARIGES